MRLSVILLLVGGVCLQNVVAMEYEEHDFIYDQQMSGSVHNEQKAVPEIDTGFLEDINFDEFFEDVGVKSSASNLHHTKVSPHSEKQNADQFSGFLEDEPLDQYLSASASQIYEVPYEDPFFASSSDHFMTRDDSYASSSNLESFGPPKDFFHDAYNFFGSEPGNEKHGTGGAQESRQDKNYSKEPNDQQKKATEKCVEKVQNGMTCKVCKDDYGGFSEHCSHSQKRGKDQKYSNSRRSKHDGPFDAKEEDKKGYDDAEKKTKERAESIATPKKTPSYLAYEQDNSGPADKGYSEVRDSFPDFNFPNDFGKTPTKKTKEAPKATTYNVHQTAPQSHVQFQPPISQPNYHHQPAYQQPLVKQQTVAQQPHNPQQYQLAYQQPVIHQQPQILHQPIVHQRPVAHTHQTYQPKKVLIPVTQQKQIPYQPAQYTVQKQQPAPHVQQNYAHNVQPAYQQTPNAQAAYQQAQKVQPAYQASHVVKPAYQPAKIVEPTYQAVHSTQPVFHVVPNPAPGTKAQIAIVQPAAGQVDYAVPQAPQYQVHVVHPPIKVQAEDSKNVVQQDKPQNKHTPTKKSDSQPTKNEFGQDYTYEPFKAPSYNPYTFEYPHNTFGFGNQKRNAHKHHIHEDDPIHAHSSTTETKYKPMNPEENFQSLGKLMKAFDKKDRKNCAKVIKKGMTCYQCKNKAGQVDEECIYEKNDPKDGVHMMYTEETSY